MGRVRKVMADEDIAMLREMTDPPPSLPVCATKLFRRNNSANLPSYQSGPGSRPGVCRKLCDTRPPVAAPDTPTASRRSPCRGCARDWRAGLAGSIKS